MHRDPPSKQDSASQTLVKAGIEVDLRIVKPLSVHMLFTRSKRHHVEKIKPGEAKAIITGEGILVFLRRLKDGTLKVAIYSDNEKDPVVFDI